MSTKSWAAAANGGWATAARWSPTVIPGAADTVLISVTGSAYSVTYNVTGATIAALTISSANATLLMDIGTSNRLLDVVGATTLSGGALDLGTHYTLTTGSLSITANTLAMTGGTLSSGTISVGASGTLSGSGSVTGSISGSGIVEGSAGTLDLVSAIGANSGVTYEVNSTASSILEAGSTIGTGNTFKFLGTSQEFQWANDTGNPTLTIKNLNVGTTAGTPTNLIDLTGHAGVTATGSGSATSGTITLSDGITLNLQNISGLTTNWFVNYKSDGASGTDIFISNAVCYAAGTRLLTPAGEMSVEDIAAGDMVTTLVGGTHVPREVKWVGERHINLTKHPRPELVAPVRIRTGAFAENVPARDLCVSPDHCVFVDGKLIPAKLLVNDMTIVQEREVRSVQYYHIELDQHSVLLAEGLPAESYLDTGNRAYFSNCGMAMVLHPEFHVNAGLKCWEEDACAPLAVSAELVEPVWSRLAARAEELGGHRPQVVTTGDADLHLVVNGRTVRPVAVSGRRYVFTLPVGASDVRVASRIAIPSDRTPWLDDWRRLGVAVKHIVVRSAGTWLDIPADHPALSDGWYGVERDGATFWRWTDGNAKLPVTAAEGATVEIDVAIVAAYPLQPAERLAA